jgi:hypothetical protein
MGFADAAATQTAPRGSADEVCGTIARLAIAAWERPVISKYERRKFNKSGLCEPARSASLIH